MTPPSHLELLFRESNALIVAALTRALGPARLDLVESVVQEAFVRAMESWSETVPENPAGWLLRVAQNLALDHVRRERSFSEREEAVAALAQLQPQEAPKVTLKRELADAQLAMIFVACHPCNSEASQLALALRTLCGLEVPAIARALFSTEEAIEKRLVLARRRVREAGVSLEVPDDAELGERLSRVLRVLYALFNEGYWGTNGPDIIQEELAAEAMRLAAFLAEHPATRAPNTHALLALMHLHASRFGARLDAHGQLVTLAEQDRSRWSAAHIEAGLRFLAASATGDEASPYHLEAAIAAAHATSPSHAQTDWAGIVGFYDALVALQPSPSARLSRAIAVGFRDGPRQGLQILETLGADEQIARLPPYQAARGALLRQLGDAPGARRAFEHAAALSQNPVEQQWLTRQAALP